MRNRARKRSSIGFCFLGLTTLFPALCIDLRARLAQHSRARIRSGTGDRELRYNGIFHVHKQGAGAPCPAAAQHDNQPFQSDSLRVSSRPSGPQKLYHLPVRQPDSRNGIMDNQVITSIDEVMLNFSPTSLQILNAVLAIVMFSIAIDLKPADFKRLGRAPKPVLVGLLSQFLVLPALTFCLVLLTTPRPSIALGLILVAACPGGNISNFITHRARGNAALSVSMTAFSSVAAIVLTPLNIGFWGSLYGPTREILQKTSIDPVSVAITVGLMLVMPLCLGLLLNVKRPDITARLRMPLQYVSMGIFLSFIALALAANWTLFLQFAGGVAALVFMHNALALFGGYASATLMGLSDFDRRAVMIETGIQNSGLGLILIFGFFGGLGGMAVVAAFWGVWHVITGIALAGLMARTEAAR